jgi:hypothetical protein
MRDRAPKLCRREHTMKKLFSAHPRLWISCAAGLTFYFALPGAWPSITRVLAGWNCGVLLFLAHSAANLRAVQRGG